MSSTELFSGTCHNCGTGVVLGMKFCVHCGVEHGNASAAMPAEDSSSVRTACSSCNFSNEHVSLFCSNCGSPIKNQQDSATTETRKTLQWNLPTQNDSSLQQSNAASAPTAVSPKVPHLQQSNAPNSSTADSPKESQSYQHKIMKSRRALPVDRNALVGFSISCLLGITLGLAVWWFGNDYIVRPNQERQFWQGHSLVVYATPIGADVTVEEAQRKATAFGKIPGTGRLIFDDLSDGEYGLFIKMPGYKSLFAAVKIESGHPCVLGFPAALKLPPE